MCSSVSATNYDGVPIVIHPEEGESDGEGQKSWREPQSKDVVEDTINWRFFDIY